MKKTCLLTLAAVAAFVVGGLSSAHANDFPQSFDFKAKLGHGVHVNIQVDVLTNPDPGCHGKTVLCVHGLGHTGNSFRPFANALFAGTNNIERVILLNLPGRGGSGYPFGRHDVPLFGELGVDDYATILNDTLAECEERDIEPSELVGHSMGGLIIQVAQEQLLSKHSSLKKAFDIKKVVLLTSSVPTDVPHPFFDAGVGVGLVQNFTDTNNPVTGPVVSLDTPTFQFLFFFNLFNQLVPGAPSVSDIDTLGYKADESVQASLDTVGTNDMRPVVRRGAFDSSKGTVLRIIVGDHDKFNPANPLVDPVNVEQGLYEYLTGGDLTHSNLLVVIGTGPVPDTTHDRHINNAAGVAGESEL